MNLTKEQQLIIDNCDSGNILVSAGPGSGKSSLLSKISEKLLENSNNRLLLVTFTNKAAKSIINKCSSIDQNRITGGTFHGLANYFAKRSNINFNICDEGKKRLIIKKLFDCKKEKDKFADIEYEISQAKSKWPMEITDNVVKYNEELYRHNLSDFDDLIYKFILLTRRGEIILPTITHILIDETQDTSAPQFEMIRAIQDTTECKCIAASDLQQSIYAFRGAEYKNTENFVKDFNCKVYNMGYNFRCAKNIVTASEKVIKNNKISIIRDIHAARNEKGLVREEGCKNIYEEIHKIIYKIFQNPDSRIAILYRNRTHKNHLEFELKKNKIKYCVNDNLGISDRSAIRTVFSCIRIASGQADIYDLEFAGKGLKGLGKVTVNQIKELVNKFNKLTSHVIKEMTLDSSNHKRLGSIISLIGYYESHKGEPLNYLAEYIETLFIKSFDYQDDMRSFILDITKDYKINSTDIRDICNDLGLNNREEENSDNRIELSTLHGFKGLERDVVIMPFCQMYGVLPDEIEEERRLFYVGMTRAKNKLYISYSGDRPRFIKEALI